MFWVKALFSETWSALFFQGIGNLNLSYLNTNLQLLLTAMYKYLQFFPEEKSLCVRFLACLSGLCLVALNTFGKHEKEGKGCTLDPEDQGWRPVYACSRCCHAQWMPFLCGMGSHLPGGGRFRTPGDCSRRWNFKYIIQIQGINSVMDQYLC